MQTAQPEAKLAANKMECENCKGTGSMFRTTPRQSLGININHFLIPTLVFKIQENVLYVYAAKTDNVDANTKLFKAPFHNVYDDGSICMGNAKIKKSFEINKIMKNYEDAFFLSKFTHLQSQGSPIKGNLNTYLNSNNKIEKKVLIDTKLKVEDLI